ncbi:Sec-independent protein translocase subunit TatA [Krasilnikovia sp. MM14-A1004]|uniref:Sec-independent protein translocase subunit TatA n=1 Tax=Krasilnikovia sp. MM14-A1004 TaxID=3373541 RepID=UPI00399CF730
MGALKPVHLLIFAAVILLLFGAKRLPDAARSLGRSLRIIKAETKGLMDDDTNVADKADAQHSRQPLHPTEIQQPGAQQPQQGFQQQPQAYQQPQQPFVDPVQRTNDR